MPDSEYEFTTSEASARGVLAGVVGVNPAVHDYRDVGPIFEKLHDIFSASRHGGPARFCGGVLFEAAEASLAKIKIDLHQSSAFAGFDGICVVIDLHGRCVFDHALAPRR